LGSGPGAIKWLNRTETFAVQTGAKEKGVPMLQRRAYRLPSRVLVQVRTPEGGFDATIGNLSNSGARLLGVPDRMVKVGDQLDIQCQGHRHLAEVRWHFDDTCGLMFQTPLADAQIDAILGSRRLN